MSKGQIIKAYKIALGDDPVGRQTREGDHKTPEGAYVLDGGDAHSSHRLKDWTDGRISVTDEEIDEIRRVFPDGTPIEIKP